MADDTKQRDNPTQPQAKNTANDNPYVFTDDEKAVLGNFDLGHPIARAWSRFTRADHFVGAPVGGMKTQLNVCSQSFQNATALMRVGDDNPNLMVQFFDARGFVGQESGL